MASDLPPTPSAAEAQAPSRDGWDPHGNNEELEAGPVPAKGTAPL